MRVKTAAALLLLGLIALVAGVGQLTFWAPPKTVTATLPADAKAAPLTVIDTKLRSLRGGEAEVTIKGDGNFVLATGRPDDVAAWVGKTAHTTIDGASADGRQLAVSYTAGDPSAPSPAGADTFATTQSASGSLDYRWDLPGDGDWQLVLATDGTKPAPHEITITWPSNETTPWAVPLIVLGVLLLAGGIALLVLRRRGPGSGEPRTGVTPAPEAGAAVEDSTTRAVPTVGETSPESAERRSMKRAASAAVAVVVALVTGAGAAQATTSPAPSGSAAPATSASATSPAAPQEKVLIDEQLQRILDQVANAVAAGDQAKDAKQLEPRVGESALLARTQNYKIRASVASAAALGPVRSSRLLTSVVTVQRSWPRTVVAVTKGDGNTTPQILTLRQDNARANYKLVEASPLLPGGTFPASLKAGAEQIGLDTKTGLAYSPNEALRGLGDRLTSTDAWKDKIPDNAYITDTLGYEADIVKSSPNADLKFTHNPTDNDAVAYRTADGGAILIAPLDFTIEGTPKSSGDKVTLADDAAAALAGGKEATTKMSLQFRESVVLYIPAVGAKQPLTLVGATRNLVGASVS